MVNININPVGFKTDSKLEEFITKKVNKVTPLYEKIQGVEIFLRLEAKGKADNKLSEVRFIIPGDDIFVKKQSDSFEASIDECIETAKRQIIKRKEKISGK